MIEDFSKSSNLLQIHFCFDRSEVLPSIYNLCSSTFFNQPMEEGQNLERERLRVGFHRVFERENGSEMRDKLSGKAKHSQQMNERDRNT